MIVSLLFILGSLAPFVYLTLAVPLGREIFSSSTGADTTSSSSPDSDPGLRLGDLYNEVNSVLGVLLGPVLGFIVDRAGMIPLLISSTLALGILTVLCPIASWPVRDVLNL